MRNLIFYLISAAIMSATGDVTNENSQALEWFELMDAEKTGCDEYKVFYNHDWKLKTKKGNLYELMKMGFSVNEILTLTNDK